MDTKESKREASVSKSLLKGFKCKSTQRSSNRGNIFTPYKTEFRALYLKKRAIFSEIITGLKQAKIKAFLNLAEYFYKDFIQDSGIY